MGLILAAAHAAGNTLRDQWKEYFYCDSIPADTICVKGVKKTTGFLNRGNDDVITDGSIIDVADGQCMIVVASGQVYDVCAEPGIYRYSNQSEPSLFAGNLGDSIKNVFAQMGTRFTFAGENNARQEVYYFNTKEITGLKYGTASPVPFRVVDRRAGIDIDISVKAFGEYSVKIIDPILFYTNVCSNVKDSYKVEQISDQMRSELLTALQPAFARLSAKGIRYSEVPGHTQELADALNEELSKKWKDIRGMEIVSLGVSSIKADEEDEKMIKEMQRNAAYKDQNLAAAALVGAQAQAMKDAANNTNGAAMGFMGMNMAQNAGGVNANTLYQNGSSKQETPSSDNSWTCPDCGTVNTDRFCSNCGKPRPVTNKWICPKCGRENTGNFCSNCGEKKPQ
ncbi:MAG: SPFH domain-containing protein [Erysipelotrichaceae bacterium]|nr:SPFH domain-containing protein [Erysipelotrichaceae bacterium]